MEIVRAQNSAQGHAVGITQNLQKENETKISDSKGIFHELPMTEMKKDMIKNAAYLAFAVALILVIEISGLYYKLF